MTTKEERQKESRLMPKCKCGNIPKLGHSKCSFCEIKEIGQPMFNENKLTFTIDPNEIMQEVKEAVIKNISDQITQKLTIISDNLCNNIKSEIRNGNFHKSKTELEQEVHNKVAKLLCTEYFNTDTLFKNKEEMIEKVVSRLSNSLQKRFKD